MTRLIRLPAVGLLVLAGMSLAYGQNATAPASRPTASEPVATPPARTQPLIVPRAATGPASAPADGPPSATASTPASQIAAVNWHGGFESAAAEAKKRNVLLVAVFFDPDSPTWESYEEQTLSSPLLRGFLANFAAARINATTGDGQKRLAATGGGEPPVTQVYSPAGELLDSVSGAIVPASMLRQVVERSGKYFQASAVAPPTPESRYRAVQTRLELSTRAKAVGEIDELLKLPADRLPEGATTARLLVARGTALLASAPDQAEADLGQARKLAPDDPQGAGRAIVLLGNQATLKKKYQPAHDLYAQYIKTFPKGPDIGEAYCNKAMLEMLPLDDRAAAVETLNEFIAKYPDDFLVIRARELLDMTKPPTTGRGRP